MSSENEYLWKRRYDYLEEQVLGIYKKLRNDLKTKVVINELSLSRPKNGAIAVVCVAAGHNLRYKFSLEANGREIFSVVRGRLNSATIRLDGHGAIPTSVTVHVTNEGQTAYNSASRSI